MTNYGFSIEIGCYIHKYASLADDNRSIPIKVENFEVKLWMAVYSQQTYTHTHTQCYRCNKELQVRTLEKLGKEMQILGAESNISVKFSAEMEATSSFVSHKETGKLSLSQC